MFEVVVVGFSPARFFRDFCCAVGECLQQCEVAVADDGESLECLGRWLHIAGQEQVRHADHDRHRQEAREREHGCASRSQSQTHGRGLLGAAGPPFHLRHTVLTVMNIGGSGYLSMQANARKAKMAKESASASEAGSGSESEVRRLCACTRSDVSASALRVSECGVRAFATLPR